MRSHSTSSGLELTSISEMERSWRSRTSEGTNPAVFYGVWTKIIIAILLAINLCFVAISGWFAVKFFRNSNIDGAVWACMTGAVSCGIMTLFVLHLARKLESWHDRATLQGLKTFSMIVGVISGVSLGVYIVLGFVNKQGFSTEGENYFSSGLFSGFCMGANALLYFTSQWYQNSIPEANTEVPFPFNRLANRVV